jgi:hypothetical protein
MKRMIGIKMPKTSKSSRKFNNKVFDLNSKVYRKDVAEVNKKVLQKQGYMVRIVEGTKEDKKNMGKGAVRIYTRPKPGKKIKPVQEVLTVKKDDKKEKLPPGTITIYVGKAFKRKDN